MSALGQKQTCAVHQPMSALPPIATAKADIDRCLVCGIAYLKVRSRYRMAIRRSAAVLSATFAHHAGQVTTDSRESVLPCHPFRPWSATRASERVTFSPYYQARPNYDSQRLAPLHLTTGQRFKVANGHIIFRLHVRHSHWSGGSKSSFLPKSSQYSRSRSMRRALTRHCQDTSSELKVRSLACCSAIAP